MERESPMKCLSLWQPWASLLVAGLKRVETRSWPIRHRGPLLIHAAKKWSRDLMEVAGREPFRRSLLSLGFKWVDDPVAYGRLAFGLPLGHIVGRVDVIECYRTEDVDFDPMGLDVTPSDPVWQYAPVKLRLWPDPERYFGDYSPGRFAFLCSSPVRFEQPIFYRGGRGLFTVPSELLSGKAKANG
jgi:hypothetical protein